MMQEDQLYELQMINSRGHYCSIARNLEKELNRQVSFADKVKLMTKPRYQFFEEEINDQKDTQSRFQRKILLMLNFRYVRFNGMPHVVTYFQDLTDSIGETELFNRYAYVNFIVDSREFKDTLHDTSKSLEQLANHKMKQSSYDKIGESIDKTQKAVLQLMTNIEGILLTLKSQERVMETFDLNKMMQ